MTEVKEIASYFEKNVPREMKMDFDNVGLLVGTERAGVTRVLVALDVSPEVIEEAASFGAELILSHHPLFFDLKSITDDTSTGRCVLRLIQKGMSCICLHTNLDSVKGGVNDALAEKLGVEVEGFLDSPRRTAGGIEYGMGRFGAISAPMSMESFLPFVKKALSTNGLRYHDAGLPVHRVALCGGSGGEFIAAALEKGCDTLVTADIKYHQFLEAKAMGLNLIDGDHFCTENVVVPVLADMLKRGFPELEVHISESWSQTVRFI